MKALALVDKNNDYDCIADDFGFSGFRNKTSVQRNFFGALVPNSVSGTINIVVVGNNAEMHIVSYDPPSAAELHYQFLEKFKTQYLNTSFILEKEVSYVLPPPRTKESLRIKFENLKRTWQNSKGFSSSLMPAFMHDSYQRIIGMGESAIPFILQELKNKPDHWGWALRAITEEDPVKPEDAGDIVAMAKAWIEWGETKGYI